MSSRLVDLRTAEVHPVHVPVLPDSTARLPLVDRASLRLGLWLLLRSARAAQRHADHTAHAHRLSAERARTARESAVLHLHQLAPRP